MIFIEKIKNKTYFFLKWTEKWTKTDMIYLAEGGFWLTLGQGASILSAFLLSVAFANLIPKETYGVYKYVLSIAGLLSIPTLSGINDSLLQSIARGKEGSFFEALKIKIKWGLWGGLAGIVIATYYWIQGNTALTFAFLIVSVFIPFMDSFAVYGSVLGGKKEFKLSTKYSVITKIFYTLIAASILFITKNIFLIILSYFAAHTIFKGIYLLLTIKKFKLNDDKELSTISYGKHLSLMRVLGAVAGQIDKILLWHFIGPAQLAIYSFSIAMPNQIRSVIKSIIMPLATPKLAAGNTDVVKSNLFPKLYKLFAMCLFTALFYILLSPLIFKSIFPNYIESIRYSQIYALILIFIPGNIILEYLVVKTQKKSLYIVTTTTQILNITLLAILTYYFGIMGIISSFYITQIYALIISLYFFRQVK